MVGVPAKEETKPQKPIKISWWKLAVGLLLVLVEIKNWLTPNQNIPDALKASNETQQVAIFAVSFAIFLVGMGLIVVGLRAIWLQRS
jgi:uncharacterized membrane protein YcjF (UPF0283 family)